MNIFNTMALTIVLLVFLWLFYKYRCIGNYNNHSWEIILTIEYEDSRVYHLKCEKCGKLKKKVLWY